MQVMSDDLDLPCSSRGCKGKMAPSSNLHRWFWCSTCSNHIKMSDEHYERFQDWQSANVLRMSQRREWHEATVAKKAKSRKVTRAPSEPEPKPEPQKKATKSTNAEYSCSVHPNYGVVRRPRTDCDGCWAAYAKKHPDRISSLSRTSSA